LNCRPIPQRFSLPNRIFTNCVEQKAPFNPREFGFDFSKEEFTHFWERQAAQNLARFSTSLARWAIPADENG